MKEINRDKLLKIINRYERRILDIEHMIPRFTESKKYDVASNFYQKKLILKSVVTDLKNLL